MQGVTNMLGENKALVIGAAAVAFFVAAVIILLVFRLAFGRRLRMPGGRARQMRLGIVDAFDLDRQRQLVIVRRDNVEHLVMIGGPNDLLIESQIIRMDIRREKDAREKEPAYAPAPAGKPHAEPKLALPNLPEPQPMAAEDQFEFPAGRGAPAPAHLPPVTAPAQPPRRGQGGQGKLPSVHEGPAAAPAEITGKPAKGGPAGPPHGPEEVSGQGFLRWPGRPGPSAPQPPKPLKRSVTAPAGGPPAGRGRPAAPQPEAEPNWPPVPSVEGIESLEEEMAKLLGRGPGKP